MYENTILKDIENVQTIYIAGHENPDGDAIGSCFGFALAMSKLGKTPVVLLDKYSEKFNILKGGEYVYKGDYSALEPDIFFALDCGDADRLGKAKAVFKRANVTYNIDHHISNTYFAQNNIVNGDASSVSEIVYELISRFVEVDKDIATALYSGILTDTRGFKHSCTSERTHIIAGKLVVAGVDTGRIHSRFMYEHSLAEAKICAVAMGRMALEDRIAYTYITKADMASVGATVNDLDGIVAYLLNTGDAELALFGSERDNGVVKLSFRSNEIDVNEIAVGFGGGGHKLASGASVHGNIEDVMAAALKVMKDKIKNA